MNKVYSDKQADEELKKGERNEILSNQLKERHDTSGPQATQNDHFATTTIRPEAKQQTTKYIAQEMCVSWSYLVVGHVAHYVIISQHGIAEFDRVIELEVRS